MMQISAQPFISEAIYRQEAISRRARLGLSGGARVAPKALPASVVEQPRPRPLWKRAPQFFDAHVNDWLEMLMERGNPCKAYMRRRSAELGFRYTEVVGPSRERPVVKARQLMMWEIKTFVKPSISYPELGRMFGGRDHSTVLYSVRKISALMAKSHDR